MARTQAVHGWETDFDVLDAGYIADPFSIWDELRTTCPVAHTDRRGSTWLPTRYEDVVALAHDVEHFSSLEVGVIPFDGDDPEEPILPYGLPPISADPPLHTWTRRLLLPWFSHHRVEGYEELTRELC
ncbi:MAG TPA: cytochrome P450, partial [Acidimicrobiales bacterium]